jgi:hypothetical protein
MQFWSTHWSKLENGFCNVSIYTHSQLAISQKIEHLTLELIYIVFDKSKFFFFFHFFHFYFEQTTKFKTMDKKCKVPANTKLIKTYKYFFHINLLTFYFQVLFEFWSYICVCVCKNKVDIQIALVVYFVKYIQSSTNIHYKIMVYWIIITL